MSALYLHSVDHSAVLPTLEWLPVHQLKQFQRMRYLMKTSLRMISPRNPPFPQGQLEICATKDEAVQSKPSPKSNKIPRLPHLPLQAQAFPCAGLGLLNLPPRSPRPRLDRFPRTGSHEDHTAQTRTCRPARPAKLLPQHAVSARRRTQ